jgi:hypothetical protein
LVETSHHSCAPCRRANLIHSSSPLIQMMKPKRYLLTFLVGIATTLSSCGTLAQTAQVPANPSLTNSAPQAVATPTLKPTAKPTAKPAVKRRPTKPQTVMVNTYKLDDRCVKQIPERAAVSAQQPMQGAIAKVIATANNNDFSLAGFRVNVKSKVATIDLRVAPGTKRQLQSLSMCERMALLGSIRKTLISNRQWQIKTVQFTDRGKKIIL